MTAAKSFLQRRPLLEARALLVAGVAPVATETIAVGDANGRIAAEDVFATHAAPHYRASAMDGIAVRSADTANAPLVLEEVASSAGAPTGAACIAVDTGSLLPEWADAVVRIEDAEAVDQTGPSPTDEPGRRAFRIAAPVVPGRDVRRIGEDIDRGTIVARSGQRLRPWDLGALVATGSIDVLVRKRPRIAILATGGEVVEPSGSAADGQIIDSSSRVIAALVEEWGGSAHRLGIVADDEAALAECIRDAARRFDAVCVIAGSSAGRKDLTTSVLASLGEVVLHGVDIAPGRPVAIARVAAGGRAATPVVAIPGYPVATIVVCEQLVRPLVAALLATAEPVRAMHRARVVRGIPSRLGMDEFRRAVVTRQTGGDVVALLPSGAGSLSSVTGAHGWLTIGATVEGIDAGADVDIELIADAAVLDHAFVLAGESCDASVRLEAALRHVDARARVHHLRRSAHDGLDAVLRGEAHAAIVGAGDEIPDGLVVRSPEGIGALFAVVEGSAGDRRLASTGAAK